MLVVNQNSSSYQQLCFSSSKSLLFAQWNYQPLQNKGQNCLLCSLESYLSCS